jgi:hypothetical protein
LRKLLICDAFICIFAIVLEILANYYDRMHGFKFFGVGLFLGSAEGLVFVLKVRSAGLKAPFQKWASWLWIFGCIFAIYFPTRVIAGACTGFGVILWLARENPRPKKRRNFQSNRVLDLIQKLTAKKRLGIVKVRG